MADPANRFESTTATAPFDEEGPFDTGASADAELDPRVVESSAPFVGRWQSLVSTTNWDKGRIICEWREALEGADANVTEYSDEAWARMVGGVTSQHSGRLRRVYQRFGGAQEQYDGLYWSHFQAALDWDDAEMWLEGALQQKWSISQMRSARVEAHGGDEDQQDDSQVVHAQLDGEGYSEYDFNGGSGGEIAEVRDPEEAAGEGGEESRSEEGDKERRDRNDDYLEQPAAEKREPKPRVRPFENLADLPDDVSDAFEHFKLAILSHKLTKWQDISRDDLLGCLEALKQLALAPSDDD